MHQFELYQWVRPFHQKFPACRESFFPTRRFLMLTGTYRFPPMDSVVYGQPFAEALKAEVEASDAHAVFLIASGTLERETDLVQQIG